MTAIPCNVVEQEEPQPIRVVLIDRDRLFARGFELLLDRASGGDVQLAGHTCDRRAAVPTVLRHGPDVIIVGMSLGADAPAVIADLKHSFPDRPVLALAAADDVEASLVALRAGVDGVLDTAQSPESFLAPLRSAVAGLAVIPSSVLKALTEGPSRRQLDCLRHLGPVDRQLWRLLAEGRDTAEISRVLLVSERTAKRRITSLLQRLGVTNRVQAAALAGCCGLLDEPS